MLRETGNLVCRCASVLVREAVTLCWMMSNVLVKKVLWQSANMLGSVNTTVHMTKTCLLCASTTWILQVRIQIN